MTVNNSHKLHEKVVSIAQLLSHLDNIAIPKYQRPYKWSQENINDLFHDLQYHHDKSAYRLGNIVFYDNNGILEIVDGQQRTLTLVLAIWAIIQKYLKDDNKSIPLENPSLINTLQNIQKNINNFLEKQEFSSDVSKYNLHQNYLEVSRIINRSDFTEHHINFLLNKCEVVTFVLNDISEAFQFFDSQNSRGRDLEPHDLLKAFHLREFSSKENNSKADTVAHWESLDTNDLAKVFAIYLYRIRQWSNTKSARYFNKNHIAIFKGVNLTTLKKLPYAESLRIVHHFIDNYNTNYQRQIDGQEINYPFQLDQTIINGRRFFEMIEYYQKMINHIVNVEYKISNKNKTITIYDTQLTHQASEIIYTLNTYKNRHRTGDEYIRNMFDCALIFYIDKFGVNNNNPEQLSLVIEKLFIWAYSCRLTHYAVKLATMDNYALKNNIFRKIKDATIPEDILLMTLPTISKNNIKGSHTDSIINLFEELKYYEV